MSDQPWSGMLCAVFWHTALAVYLRFFHPNHIANIYKLWWNSYRNMTRILVVILIFAMHECVVQNTSKYISYHIKTPWKLKGQEISKKMESWILPKNEWSSLSWVLKVLTIVSFVCFFGRIQDATICFRDLVTFTLEAHCSLYARKLIVTSPGFAPFFDVCCAIKLH